MSRLMITGADGSLGTALMTQAAQRRYFNPIGMPRAIWHKRQVDVFIAALPELVDTVIINDGTNHLSWIGTTGEEDDEIVQRNLMTPYWILNALARRNRPCRVVIVTSQTYRVPQRTTALYCASKAGLAMLMRVAARELAPKGWVINAVAPGKIVDTAMSKLTDEQVCELRGWTTEDADTYAAQLIPAGRFTDCNEVCDVIYQTLALPGYVNGTTIEVFGGV